jgi:hypothetical protein
VRITRGQARVDALRAGRVEHGRQRRFDRREFLDPRDAADWQGIDDEQRVDVRIGPHRAAAHGAEDRQRDEAVAIVAQAPVEERIQQLCQIPFGGKRIRGGGREGA